MKKNVFDYSTVILGILLFGIGLFLVKCISEPEGILLSLPYICIGIGCGMLGHGIGNVINHRIQAKNPAMQKQMEIDKHDERSIAVARRAKAKAYDLMVFVIAALMIAFALMGVNPAAVLLLVFSYLLIIGYGIYYQYKYNKEM